MRLGVVIGAFVAGVLSTQLALANAPGTSLYPVHRPGTTETVKPERAFFDRVSAGLKKTIRPKSRPGQSAVVAAPIAAPVVQVSAVAVARSLRPQARPGNFVPKKIVPKKPVQNAALQIEKKPTKKRKTRKRRAKRIGRKGSVCGVNGIKGEKMSPIRGKLKACGVAEPVRVTSVDGVTLTQSATIDCTTAKALNTWVKDSVKPIIGRLGGGVSSIKVVAHYACRTRNNKRGAKMSEHAKGRAVDIAAINLKNGSSITVLKGWRNRTQGKILKKLHKQACGPFGTVLGPNADRYHQDHFHFDTARYRNGSYCK